MTSSNYQQAHIARLEALIQQTGGIVPPMTNPTNFEARSLQLLEVLNTSITGADRLIGNNWEMRRATKPVSRPDGSALSIGDTLILSDGSSWTWNGTYWLGARRTHSVFGLVNAASAISVELFTRDIFIYWVSTDALFNSPQNSTNYFRWRFETAPTTSGLHFLTFMDSAVLNLASGNVQTVIRTNLNAAYSLAPSTPGANRYVRIGNSIGGTATGSPGPIQSPLVTLQYSEIL